MPCGTGKSCRVAAAAHAACAAGKATSRTAASRFGSLSIVSTLYAGGPRAKRGAAAAPAARTAGWGSSRGAAGCAWRAGRVPSRPSAAAAAATMPSGSPSVSDACVPWHVCCRLSFQSGLGPRPLHMAPARAPRFCNQDLPLSVHCGQEFQIQSSAPSVA